VSSWPMAAMTARNAVVLRLDPLVSAMSTFQVPIRKCGLPSRRVLGSSSSTSSRVARRAALAGRRPAPLLLPVEIRFTIHRPPIKLAARAAGLSGGRKYPILATADPRAFTTPSRRPAVAVPIRTADYVVTIAQDGDVGGARRPAYEIVSVAAGESTEEVAAETVK
jgi:hypothetical protein